MLNGARVLLVEDEFLVAEMASEMLIELGARVLGPAANADQALAAIEAGGIDVALVDLNLSGVRSDAVVSALRERGVPFVIATGYGASAAPPGTTVLEKPYTAVSLAAALVRVLRPN